MTHLYLVRHGEAEGNHERRYLGTTDAPLTTRGLVQVQALGDAFAAIPLAAVVTSPLARTRATATAIAAPHGLAPEVVPDLRELDFGAWEGQTRSEVLATAPAELTLWEEDGPEAAPPGGESPAMMMARVVPVLRTLAARDADATIVVVSHVTPIKLAISAALALPPRSMRRMWLDPAGISLLEWDIAADRAMLRLFNAVRPDR